MLAGGNNYQGTTQILSGVLAVCNASGLGLADGAADEGTTLSNGASLEIDGPLTIANELLTVVPSSGSYPALYSYNPGGGVNVWTGGVNLNASVAYGSAFLLLYSESGSLEVDGNIVGGAYTQVYARRWARNPQRRRQQRRRFLRG